MDVYGVGYKSHCAASEYWLVCMYVMVKKEDHIRKCSAKSDADHKSLHSTQPHTLHRGIYGLKTIVSTAYISASTNRLSGIADVSGSLVAFGSPLPSE
jgi:hypothetical protein